MPHSVPLLFLNGREDTADELILKLRQMMTKAVGKASSRLEESNKQDKEGEEEVKLKPVLRMQQASRLLVVTFRQQALVYTRRAHID